MFQGLSAFPLTPLMNGNIDETAFTALIENLASAGVDSIGALGSTGSYAYLTREQRYRAIQLAVSAAADTPVITSIGSVNVEEVLRLAEDAQQAGVSGVLLAPVSYQRLRDDEVFRLYERVGAALSVPLCIYDNPDITRFEFTDELLVSLSQLKHTASIKLAHLPLNPNAAQQRVSNLKQKLATGVTLGISGDANSAAGLLAGCDVWYSVLAGLFPNYCIALTRAALDGNASETQRLNEALEPLWAFYRRHGSLRVIATVAEIVGAVTAPCLPFPLQSIVGEEREMLREICSAHSSENNLTGNVINWSGYTK